MAIFYVLLPDGTKWYDDLVISDPISGFIKHFKMMIAKAIKRPVHYDIAVLTSKSECIPVYQLATRDGILHDELFMYVPIDDIKDNPQPAT